MTAVNLTGVFLCAQAARYLACSLGSTEPSSTLRPGAAQLGVPRLALYAAAKGGVITFTRSVARGRWRAGRAGQLHRARSAPHRLLAERAKDPEWAKAKLSAQVQKRFAEADESRRSGGVPGFTGQRPVHQGKHCLPTAAG